MRVNNELCHYGIKGQRWGVRRFQNEDGTYTAEGRKRKGLSPEQKEKLKVGVGAGLGVAALTVGAVVLAAKRPQTIQALGRSLGKMGANSVKELGDATKRAGKAAADAAMASMATIAIAKVSQKLAAKDTDREGAKIASQIAIDASKAAINSTVSGNKKITTYKSGPVSKEDGAKISAVVGAPRQKEIDRTGPEYQALFKDGQGNTRSAEDRAIIKSMASAGYGIDQIQQYLDTFAHAASVGREYLASIL